MDITEILLEEKRRLEVLRDKVGDRYSEFARPFFVDKTEKRPDGTTVLVSYIDCDVLSIEQRETLNSLDDRWKEAMARLCVLENFIKSNVPPEVFKTYNQHVEPISTYQDVTINCSDIGMDEKGMPIKYSIKVGPSNVSSPRVMPLLEYARLYTASLSKVLQLALGNNFSKEEAEQRISEACKDVYLNGRIPLRRPEETGKTM